MSLRMSGPGFGGHTFLGPGTDCTDPTTVSPTINLGERNHDGQGDRKLIAFSSDAVCPYIRA